MYVIGSKVVGMTWTDEKLILSPRQGSGGVGEAHEMRK